MDKQCDGQEPNNDLDITEDNNEENHDQFNNNAVIDKLKPGIIDPLGNIIIHIHTKCDEFAIYDFEHHDKSCRMRVYIKGKTEESEKALIKKYSIISGNYSEAKSLLSRSSNIEVMKTRIASEITSCLLSDNYNKHNFDLLIETLKKDIKHSIRNRICFSFPAILLTIIGSLILFFVYEGMNINTEHCQIIIVLFSSIIGGTFSILLKSKGLLFYEKREWYYLVVGLERLFLACLAGISAYILIKSKIVLSELEFNNIWQLIAIIITAAFSESLMPSLLGKIDEKMSK